MQIILFQDAFEICNPLGSAKSKYKIIGVYLTLGYLPSYMRSKTDSIKLVELCKEKIVKKFGCDLFFKNIIQDLKILETVRIRLLLSGVEYHFKGSLLFMLGDSLGSHDIGGFVRFRSFI